MVEAMEAKKVFKYVRTCRLEECDIEIRTNRERHYFCRKEHHDQWWGSEKLDKSSIKRQLARHESDITKIKERLGME